MFSPLNTDLMGWGWVTWRCRLSQLYESFQLPICTHQIFTKRNMLYFSRSVGSHSLSLEVVKVPPY